MKTVTLCILALFPAGIAVADEAEHRKHLTAIELVDWSCSIWLTVGR